MTIQESVEPPQKKSRQRKSPTVFEILNEHAVGKFFYMNKRQLVVPVNDYQRDESKGRIASEIAMHYDKVAFGALTVIHRQNGEYAVADGGTRLAAALLRDDIGNVPCMVYSGLTEKEEGDVFLRINNNRRKLQAEQLHKAELYSAHELATITQRHLDYLTDHRVGFDSLRTMRSCTKVNVPATSTVVVIIAEIAADKYLTARVLKALFRLEVILNKDNRTLNRKFIVNRMREEFHSFDAVVNAMVKPQATGNTTQMAYALARTLRIKIPKQE